MPYGDAMSRATTREAQITVAVAALAVVVLAAVVAVDPATCFRDDMMAQYLGASREVWLAAKHGHLALMTPRSWFGGALAAEYQHGVFSIFAVTTDVLAWSIGGSLRGTAFVLVAVPVAWLAAGTFRLARVEGTSISAAVFAAMLATFNGWTLRWAVPWYPALASFAWVPWLAWALRRCGRPLLVTPITYATAVAGWPYTVGIAGLVGSWLVVDKVRRTRDVRWAATAVFAAALGLGLAAPALLMLRQYAAASVRLRSLPGTVHAWTVPLGALPGLLTPIWHANWHGVDHLVFRVAPELLSVVGLAVIASAWLARSSRAALLGATRAWMGVALLALVLASLPSRAPFRWSFRWLPLWHLALALVAAKALDALAPDKASRREPLAKVRRLILHPGAICLLLVVASSLPLLGSGAAQWTAVARVVFAAVLGCGFWYLASASRLRRLRASAPSAIAVSATLFTLYVSPASDSTTWKLTQALAAHGPLDPARTYLALVWSPSVATPPVGFNAQLRFGNLALLSGLSFVNGYSPLGPRVVWRTFPFDTHGWLCSCAAAPRAAHAFVDDGTILDRLGVDGLVVTPDLGKKAIGKLVSHGWSPAGKVKGGLVLHKGATPAPRAWLLDESARDKHLSQPGLHLEESDTAATVTLSAPLARPALVVFKRVAYPGYRARVDGVEAPVQQYLGTLVAVSVPAGTRGPVTVAYRPRSLERGLALAALALALFAGWLARDWVRRRKSVG